MDLTLALLPPLLFAPAEKYALSGVGCRFLTGVPLKKAQVLLRPLDSAGGGTFSTSDARERFRMAGLDSGRYRMTGKRNGHLATAYGCSPRGFLGN